MPCIALARKIGPMKLAVINTGGTITCTGNPLSPMAAEPFAQACQEIVQPALAQEFPDLEIDYVTDLRFPESASGTLDSTNLQPTDWCLLAQRILEDYDLYDGWVILHGTDSMAYTGSALPFLLSAFDRYGNATIALDKPVIITGSQVPLFQQDTPDDPLTLRYNTDAFQNVCAAVAAARTGTPEVGVAFRGHVFRGPRVVKSNASEDHAFSSPNFPELAQVGINFELNTPVVLPGPVSSDVALSNPEVRKRAQERLSFIAGHIDANPVVLLPAFPAAFASDGATAFLAKLIDAVVSAGAKGIVLESYGEGNYPSGNPDRPEDGAVARALKAATQSGVTVVDATQVQAGTVNATAYASGAWLPWAGAIGIGDMTSIAAFAKTMVLLAEQGWDGSDWEAGTVRNLIGQSLAGECAVTDRIGVLGRNRLLPGESLVALDGSATLKNHPKRGPVLYGEGGKVLWEARTEASGNLPGNLVADGGSVRFLGRDGTTLWDAAPGTPAAGLALRGSLVDGTLELVVTAIGGGVAKAVFG